MRLLTDIKKKYFKYFSLFYKYLKYRVFVLLSLSFFVGIFDGFGIALFIPLIQASVDGEGELTDSFGNFKFIFDFFERMGLDITVPFLLGLMIFLFLLKGFFKFLDTYYKTLLQSYFVKNLRYKMVNSLEGMKFTHFTTMDAGEIQNTLSGEVYKVTASFIAYFNTVQSVVLLLVYFALAFFSNWQFALLVSIGGGLSNILFKRLYYYTEKASKSISSSSHTFQSYIIQAVQHFKYLKATSHFEIYKKKVLTTIDQIEGNQRKIGFYNAILSGAREPIILIVIIMVVIIQMSFIGGEFSSIAMSLMFFYRSMVHVIAIQSSWQGFISNIGGIYSAENLIGTMESGKEIVEDSDFQLKSFDYRIKDVEFGYGEKPPILKNINTVFGEKETTAFVGPSGGGKSTFINMIVGLIKPTKGKIEIGGVELDSLNINKFRKRVGYITQEPVIFNDSVFNNVTFWSTPDPENMRRFYDSLKLAKMDSFVKEMPNGHNTVLGDNGMILSGGQKQRISIAREIYKNVDILVFDEATSALDSQTERDIQNNIDSLKGKFSIFIVAHRLSTIRKADRIILLEDGEIIEQGDFEYLLENSPKFKHMVSYQKF